MTQDSEELHMVDYLPSKKTIISQYYAEIMFKLYDSSVRNGGNCH